MRPSEYRALLDRALPLGKKILVVGKQGCGKSQIAEDYCTENGWDHIGICMPMIDASFLCGYPFRSADGRADHLAFGPMARALDATRPTLMVLDEIGGAGDTVLKSSLRLLQNREVGSRKLPDCVRIIAMSNDVQHGAGVMGIIEPAKSRFDSIVNLEPHLDDTIVYGLVRGWPAWLLAFLRNSPESVYDYTPVKSMQIGGSDPRGWEAIAKWDLDGFFDGPNADEIACGRVGVAHGTKALAYRKLVHELPDINALLIAPDAAPVPENPGAQYLVAHAIASVMNGRNFGQCIRYMLRLPQLVRAFVLNDAFKAEKEKKRLGKLDSAYVPIHASADFTAWVVTADGKEIYGA